MDRNQMAAEKLVAIAMKNADRNRYATVMQASAVYFAPEVMLAKGRFLVTYSGRENPADPTAASLRTFDNAADTTAFVAELLGKVIGSGRRAERDMAKWNEALESFVR